MGDNGGNCGNKNVNGTNKCCAASSKDTEKKIHLYPSHSHCHNYHHYHP